MPRPYRPNTLEYIYLKHKKRMTTPRIEEMAADLHNNIVDCVYGMNLDIGGKEAKRLYAELSNSMLLRKQLTQALTQAHQAGIDEAVAVGYKKALREIDIGSHNYVQSRRAISELSGKPMMALTFNEHIDAIKEKIQALDDTIKTLQDKK